MKEFNLYGWVAFILIIIGGLNWGIFGIFGGDLVTAIFGNLLGRLIFIIVGVAAGYMCYLVYLDKFKK